MSLLTAIVIITTILAIVLIFLAIWLPTLNPDYEKLSPFECGFDPIASARNPFSLHFFLVAILFLLFDLEIALLLPLPWADQLSSPLTTFFLTFVVLALLTSGLLYESVQGGLEWAQ